jgi:hypothetical protein
MARQYTASRRGRKAVSARPSCGWAVRTLLAIVLALPVWKPVAAQERADVEIANRSFQNVEIRVFDNLCRVLLYRGVLIHNTSTNVACCKHADNRCSLSIYDQMGRRHDYAGVLSVIPLVVH